MKEGNLARYVKGAYEALGVVGEGFRKHMTAHGLHSSCIMFLFEAGSCFGGLRKRAHRDLRSALWYQDNGAALGQELQTNMFVEDISIIKMVYKNPFSAHKVRERCRRPLYEEDLCGKQL